MYQMMLTKDLKVLGVSPNFKNLMADEEHNLRDCFFMSFIDCEVPDQLAEDIEISLSRGLNYSTCLHFNVVKDPRWFDVSITPYYKNGTSLGYLASINEVHSNDCQKVINTYSQINSGAIRMKHGFPVKNHFDIDDENAPEEVWYKRVR